MAAVHVGVGLVGRYEPVELKMVVRFVEEEGYHSLWVADERLYRNVYVTLTLAALCSKTLRLGTGVTNPFTRHPALTAAAAASVDEVSGGRLVLGLGAGGSATAVLGTERVRPAQALREAVQIIRTLTAGEAVDFHGEVFSFTGRLDFAPLRRVPVYVAARGPRSLEVAGEVADGVIIGGLVGEEGVAYCLDGVRRGARRAGRDLADVVKVAWIYVACSSRREEAEDAVRQSVALSVIASRPVIDSLELPLSTRLRAYLDDRGWLLRPDVIAGAAQLVDSALLEEFAVAGTPAACGRKLERIVARGVDELAMLVQPVQGQSFVEGVAALTPVLREGGYLS